MKDFIWLIEGDNPCHRLQGDVPIGIIASVMQRGGYIDRTNKHLWEANGHHIRLIDTSAIVPRQLAG